MFRMDRRFTTLVLAALLLGACLPAPLPTATPVVSAPAAAVPTATAAAATAPTATTPAPVSPTPEPRPVDPDAMTKKTLDFTSQALAGNLLGDPATRSINILLPPGYATSEKRYPVVYVLHYYTGSSDTFLWDFKTAFERAHKAGEVRDMIMVFPDASNKLGGGWYLDSPTTGGYETSIARELVNYIDSQFRTIPQSESRGITGCSMGGDGAAHLALKYPDVFSVAAAISAMYDWGPVFITQDPKDVTHMPKDMADFDSLPFYEQVVISRAAAAAPNPDNPPFYLDMPFVISDGKPQPVAAVWEKMGVVDPSHDAMKYTKQPQRLRVFMLYHGTSDDMVPVERARQYDKLLTDLGIEHNYVEVENRGHCELDYQPVLKFMSDHLTFGTPTD